MSISGLPVGEKEKPDESSASNSTVSSGIGSGASLKSTELDAMSVGSGTVGLGKVLSLSLKGEWMLLEQVLRTLDKGNPDVSQREEVRHCTAYGSRTLNFDECSITSQNRIRR